ncbi:MAG: TolC family protein [Gammaproteobacteria bacterium]|nr:TolC family protein [Gammaproteobacteria bacterium]
MLFFPISLRAAAPAAGLTLGDAVRQSLAKRPELAAFAFETRQREAGIAAAGLRPAPQVEVLLEDAPGTGARKGFDAAQASLLLSQVIELGGKREARVAVARASGTALANDRAIAQLDIVADVGRRFIEVLRGQARHELAQEGVRIAERTLASVQQRVDAARAPEAEAARAHVALVDARLALEDTEHELEIARRYLAAAMGDREARFGQAVGDLGTMPPSAALDELLARLEQSPDLLQFADEARVRDSELRLAELRRRADVRGTLGLRRFEQGNDFALVAGVTMPLFASRHAQPQVDAARARAERIPVERESAFLRLQSELYSLYLQLGHERELSATLRQELMPRLQQALDLTAFAYERGRYSFLEWSSAQSDLLEGRRRLIESTANFHLLRVEIERLTASGIDVSGVNP